MANENQDALNLVGQICNAFQGNLEEHQKIQHALHVISEALTPKEEEAVKEPLKEAK